jgi:DNA-directed RNA polymerase subunit RPC12/RpoP
VYLFLSSHQMAASEFHDLDGPDNWMYRGEAVCGYRCSSCGKTFVMRAEDIPANPTDVECISCAWRASVYARMRGCYANFLDGRWVFTDEPCDGSIGKGPGE